MFVAPVILRLLKCKREFFSAEIYEEIKDRELAGEKVGVLGIDSLGIVSLSIIA